MSHSLMDFNKTPPSRAMESAWTTSGRLCAIECVCGRVHFLGRGTSHGDYEPGELESLEASAGIDPARYVQILNYDSIDTGNLLGKNVVLGCPCNALARYEEFLREHRWQILRFFQNLAEESRRTAKDADRIATELADALKAVEGQA